MLPPVALLEAGIGVVGDDGVEPEPPEPLPMTNTVAGDGLGSASAPLVSDGLAVKVLPPLSEALVAVTSPFLALPPLPPWALLVPPAAAPPVAEVSPVVRAAARVGLAVIEMEGVEPEPPPEPLEFGAGADPGRWSGPGCCHRCSTWCRRRCAGAGAPPVAVLALALLEELSTVRLRLGVEPEPPGEPLPITNTVAVGVTVWVWSLVWVGLDVLAFRWWGWR